MAIPTKFRFRRNDNIGANTAEDDSAFLADCFIDNGMLACLRDVNDAKRIVVGRTGTGKTALLQELKRREHNTIEIDPEAMSMNYIANSQVFRFYEQLGVRLT